MTDSPNDDLDQPGDTLVAPESAKPVKQTKAEKKAQGMPDYVWIQIEENDDIPPTGLFVGHNGTGYLIRPGEPVRVPVFLIDILDHAVATVSITDPTSRQVIGHRERRRYPYRRVDAPEGQR